MSQRNVSPSKDSVRGASHRDNKWRDARSREAGWPNKHTPELRRVNGDKHRRANSVAPKPVSREQCVQCENVQKYENTRNKHIKCKKNIYTYINKNIPCEKDLDDSYHHFLSSCVCFSLRAFEGHQQVHFKRGEDEGHKAHIAPR